MDVGRFVNKVLERFAYGVIIAYAVFWLAACVLAIFLPLREAFGHEAPTGWRYPYTCCSDRDCRALPESAVRETAAGYQVPSGDVIPYGDKRVRNSPDGLFHWCSVGGKGDSRTICLFVPPRAF